METGEICDIIGNCYLEDKIEKLCNCYTDQCSLTFWLLSQYLKYDEWNSGISSNNIITFHLIDDEILHNFPMWQLHIVSFYCKNEKFPFLIKFSKKYRKSIGHVFLLHSAQVFLAINYRNVICFFLRKKIESSRQSAQ
jgi:hypothetical protein